MEQDCRSPGQRCSHLSGKSGSSLSCSPALYQVITPTSKVDLLKLLSGVPHEFFPTETQRRRAATPATQY